MPKVLVADDNTNIQKMVARALEERGIGVVSVGNGEAAVRRLPDVNPDLILADIFMPARNGYEVCEFVKKDRRFAHVPVILLMGAFDPLDEKEARRVCADGVLKKPFVPPDPLIAMVLSALEKNPKIAADDAREKKKAAADAAKTQSEVSQQAEPSSPAEFSGPGSGETDLEYSFGKGRRSLGGEHDDTDELAATRAESDEAAENDSDHGVTDHDWRRSAMDFEIPPETANRFAFSPDEIFEPAPAVFEPTESLEKDRLASPAQEFTSVPPDESNMPPANFYPAVEEPPVVEATADSAPEPSVHVEEPTEPSATPSESDLTGGAEAMETERPAIDWGTAPVEKPAEADASDHELAPETDRGSSFADDERLVSEEPAQSPAPLESAATEHIVTHDTAIEVGAYGAAQQDEALETAPPDAEPPVAFTEPGLVRPPAVQVTPEPLLVSEEQNVAPERDEPVETIAAADASSSSSWENPAAEDPADAVSSWLSSDAERNGRMPTMPPPNREALEDIAFLTPPSESAAPPVDPATVDAVVRKVLERLEPRLYDLFSEGVLKPLVEDVLQNEAPKK